MRGKKPFKRQDTRQGLEAVVRLSSMSVGSLEQLLRVKEELPPTLIIGQEMDAIRKELERRKPR